MGNDLKYDYVIDDEVRVFDCGQRMLLGLFVLNFGPQG